MRKRVLIAAVVVCGLVVAGTLLRQQLHIRAEPQALREWVASFGWWGPVAFGLLVTFRHAFILSSSLLLALGGAVLGGLVGGTVGTIGLFLSAVGEFWLFRYARPDGLVSRIEARSPRAAATLERGAPVVIFASTAIPLAPMTPVYWAASLTSISVPRFALLAGVSGAIRAFSLALLGAGVVESDWWLVAAVCAAVVLLAGTALLFPSVRHALLPGAGAGRAPLD